MSAPKINLKSRNRDLQQGNNKMKSDSGFTQSIRESYDRLAEEYGRRIYNELQSKPLDRQLLERFASTVAGKGIVCDIGCGPGHIARYLHDFGVREVVGVDLSVKMLEQAQRLNPGISFLEGNMLALALPDQKFAGIVSFYSICNIPKEYLPIAFGEINRVLKKNGLLLIAFHTGDGSMHEKELWGFPISMDFFLYQPSLIRKYLEEVGFSIEDITERDPYAPEVEYQSRRAYIFARKPE